MSTEYLDGLDPLTVIREPCPVCGKSLLRWSGILPVHTEPGGECPASGQWRDIAESLARIRLEDPRLLDRAHP